MKNKKFKFTILELLIVLIGGVIIGALSLMVIDKTSNDEPYLSTLGSIGLIAFPVASVIVRNRIKVVEI